MSKSTKGRADPLTTNSSAVSGIRTDAMRHTFGFVIEVLRLCVDYPKWQQNTAHKREPHDVCNFVKLKM